MSEPSEPTKASKEPPLQWFRAEFAGEYFGKPNPDAPKAAGRRLALNVYRLQARAVVLVDAPAADAAPEDVECWQPRIDEALLPHVLGPGTAYRGPVFEARLRQIRLSCPIEHGGRAYGRIEGSLTGAFVMPDKPPVPAVKVVTRKAPSPKATPEKPLEATLSLGQAPLPGARPAALTEQPAAAPSATLRGLAALLVLVGVALAVQSGAGYAAFWALCALPILPLRWMFHEMVRPSTLVRATALAACVASIACGMLVVHAFRACAPLPWWPGLVALLLLVPLAPMPSPLPTVVGLLSLALIVGLFSARSHHGPCTTSHPEPERADVARPTRISGFGPRPAAYLHSRTWKMRRAARWSGCSRSPQRSRPFCTSPSTTSCGCIATAPRSRARSC